MVEAGCHSFRASTCATLKPEIHQLELSECCANGHVTPRRVHLVRPVRLLITNHRQGAHGPRASHSHLLRRHDFMYLVPSVRITPRSCATSSRPQPRLRGQAGNAFPVASADIPRAPAKDPPDTRFDHPTIMGLGTYFGIRQSLEYAGQSSCAAISTRPRPVPREVIFSYTVKRKLFGVLLARCC